MLGLLLRTSNPLLKRRDGSRSAVKSAATGFGMASMVNNPKPQKVFGFPPRKISRKLKMIHTPEGRYSGYSRPSAQNR